MSEITAKMSQGFRTEFTAGRHTLVGDEPESAGGTNQGPTPYDYLAMALGGCTAMTLRFYAKRENIALEGVEVVVRQNRIHASDCAECDAVDGFVHEFQVEIRLQGDLDSETRQRLLRVAQKCPVYKTLHSEIRIREKLID